MVRALALVFCLAAALPSGAMAGCKGQIAGPVSNQSLYYFASSCFNLQPNQVRLRHEVCSVSPKILMFKWTKLNWVSGSEGVEYGGCLVRTSIYSDAQRVGNSLVTANDGSAYTTEVYLPNLNAGNRIYFDTVDGGGPRVAGGDREAFHFAVRYLVRDDKRIEIHAEMSGQRPVFFLVLPSSIRNSDDLNRYIADDNMRRISPLVDFGSKALLAKLHSDDVLLAEFIKDNNVAGRGSITIQGETDTASIDFTVVGELREMLPEWLICLGQSEGVSTCFQAGPPQ